MDFHVGSNNSLSRINSSHNNDTTKGGEKTHKHIVESLESAGVNAGQPGRLLVATDSNAVLTELGPAKKNITNENHHKGDDDWGWNHPKN